MAKNERRRSKSKWNPNNEHFQPESRLGERRANEKGDRQEPQPQQDTYSSHPRNAYNTRQRLYHRQIQNHHSSRNQKRRSRSSTRRNRNNDTWKYAEIYNAYYQTNHQSTRSNTRPSKLEHAHPDHYLLCAAQWAHRRRPQTALARS